MRRPLLLIASLVALAAPPARAQDLAARLDSAVRAAERNGFSGVVRVERDGAVVLERGYGLADRARRVAFTPATVVQIGSNTKDFTAVAVLRLQARGLLSLDDTLGRFFGAAPPDKRGITVRQLLTHRAGFPLGIGGDFEPVGREAFVERALRTPLLFAPGSRSSYSNTGYSLLAAIVEQITGTSYDAHVRDAILAPLGLRRTGFLLPAFAPNELARGYLAAGTAAGTMLEKPHAPDGPWWNLRGNGGMLSTVGDMAAFYHALFDGERLLTRDERRPMFDPEQPAGLAGSDGVSFFLYERAPRARVSLIVASTNAAVKAPVVRRALAEVLGLPLDVGGGERVARRPGGRAAPAAVDALVRAFVGAIDLGDTTALRRFVTEHFAAGSGMPTVDERMTRLRGLHEELGAVTVRGVEVFDDGSVEAAITTAVQGAAVLRVDVDGATPPRIRRLQLMVGGG
jgi:CubicO group peptidase (beta-lactamase class C family)